MNFFSTKVKEKKDSWYVMQVKAGKEPNIKKHLTEKNIFGIKELIVPEPLDIKIKTDDDKELRDRYKHFMGYVFVKLSLDYLTYVQILEIDNIYRFLGNLYRKKNKKIMYTPMFIREKEIKRVKSYLFDGAKKKEKEIFNIGDKVKIKDGDLANIEGKVVEVNDDQVKLVPQLFLQKIIKVSSKNLVRTAV